MAGISPSTSTLNNLISSSTRSKTAKIKAMDDDGESESSIKSFASEGSPRNKKRKRKYKQLTMTQIPTANSFEMLTDNNDDNALMPPPKSNLRTARTQNEVKSTKPNAIDVYGVENELIQRLVKELKSKATYAKRNNFFRVFTANLEDKKSLLETLKSKNYKFHTYTEKSERHLAFLLTGHHNVSPAELLKKLQSEGCNAISCSYLVNHPKNPIYIVQFEKGTTSFMTLQQKHSDVEHLKVTWQKFDPARRRPVQCKRCQSWGHSASNCNHQFRCVKCSQDHEPGHCPRPAKSIDENVFCVNCKKNGHPANSPSCEAYKSYAEKLKINKTSRTTYPPIHPHRSLIDRLHNDTITSSSQNRREQVPNFISQNEIQFPSLSQPSAKIFSSQFTVNGTSNNHQAHSESLNSVAGEKNMFAELAELKQELNNLPHLKETILRVKSFIHKFKNSKSNEQRDLALMSFFQISCV